MMYQPLEPLPRGPVSALIVIVMDVPHCNLLHESVIILLISANAGSKVVNLETETI